MISAFSEVLSVREQLRLPIVLPFSLVTQVRVHVPRSASGISARRASAQSEVSHVREDAEVPEAMVPDALPNLYVTSHTALDGYLPERVIATACPIVPEEADMDAAV